jgi:hypothetical protein
MVNETMELSFDQYLNEHKLLSAKPRTIGLSSAQSFSHEKNEIVSLRQNNGK